MQEANWQRVMNWNPKRVPAPQGLALGKQLPQPCPAYKGDNQAVNALPTVSRSVEGFSLELFDVSNYLLIVIMNYNSTFFTENCKTSW